MPAENAIEIKNVTKIYRLYDKPVDRLKESLSVTHKLYHKDFYALSGISFTVEKGQTVGIIGTNGSGKSTILKIITGVLTPTTGTVTVQGKISALLELGAGFNMDYTGLENIYMNGTMMGYSRKEMDGKLQEILDFAEIGDFVYQPVKTYSSGMFVRLAFALAINVEPEILIVDEALSVGDVFFQSKCYRKMEEIRKKGTTIVMVTHDMGSIIKYCDKVILLNRGEFIAQGSAGKMVDLYKKILANQLDSLKEELAQMNDFSGDKVVEPERAGGAQEAAAGEGSTGEDGRAESAAGKNRTGKSAAGKDGTEKDRGEKDRAEKDCAEEDRGEKDCSEEGHREEDREEKDCAKEGHREEDLSGKDDAEKGSADGTLLAGDFPQRENAFAAGAAGSQKPGFMKDHLTINANRTEYGDGRAEIFDLGLEDERGNLTNLLLKGETFTIRERIRFHADIQAPIFTYTIKDKKGTELTGTNTMFEGADIKPVRQGDVYDVAFRQKMTLQGGEYLLSMSCTSFEQGEHVVYHRLYDVANITVISNKNTVGVYDMESEVEAALSKGGEETGRDGRAKESADRGGRAKESAGRDGRAKESAGRDGRAKESAGRDGRAKESADRGGRAKESADRDGRAKESADRGGQAENAVPGGSGQDVRRES